MSNTTTVSCQECHKPIDERASLPTEERKPCPKCKSTFRDFNVHVMDGFRITDTATVTVSPNILVQAVVTFAGKTSEGKIIQAVAPAWFEIAKMIEKDPSLIYQIDARKWEELLAGWYKEYGFDDVTLTPRSGDYGRDVIAIKHGVLSVRIIDSVKRTCLP
jgi:restriction system protein